MASKCKHNQMIGELGSQSLLDSHIAILICCRLPEHLRQQVTHLMDNAITTDQLVKIIYSYQQQSEIQTMQASTSDTALYGCQNKSKKKHNLQPCKTPALNWTHIKHKTIGHLAGMSTTSNAKHQTKRAKIRHTRLMMMMKMTPVLQAWIYTSIEVSLPCNPILICFICPRLNHQHPQTCLKLISPRDLH